MTYTELKIRLMQQGAVFAPSARRTMCASSSGEISFMDYATTGGVVMVLDERVYANVPVKFRDTPFRVELQADRLILLCHELPLPHSVRIIPVPKYALDARRLSDGTLVSDAVMTHADRVRISPVNGCAFHCSFCTCNHLVYWEKPCALLDEAFRIALADPYNRPRHALISGGTPKATAESYEWLNAVYHHFPTTYPDMEFDVMLSPRCLTPAPHCAEGYTDFLRFLRDDCGVRTLSVNLELYNETYRRRLIPEKAAIGVENYRLFIKKAVDIFGPMTVRSSLIAGLEPTEDTLLGVRLLSEIGCIPVLSAFVPAPGTDGAACPAPAPEFLLELVEKAGSAAGACGLPLGPLCHPCAHNSITMED